MVHVFVNLGPFMLPQLLFGWIHTSCDENYATQWNVLFIFFVHYSVDFNRHQSVNGCVYMCFWIEICRHSSSHLKRNSRTVPLSTLLGRISLVRNSCHVGSLALTVSLSWLVVILFKWTFPSPFPPLFIFFLFRFRIWEFRASQWLEQSMSNNNNNNNKKTISFSFWCMETTTTPLVWPVTRCLLCLHLPISLRSHFPVCLSLTSSFARTFSKHSKIVRIYETVIAVCNEL